MANTITATGLKRQTWETKFYMEFLRTNYFNRFMGTDEKSIIQMREMLMKERGDSITLSLVNRLTSAGVTGNADLEGNEEAILSRSMKIVVDQKRNAVIIPMLEMQFSAIDLMEAARPTLMDWRNELFRDDVITSLGSINGVDYGLATEPQKDAWLVDNADRVVFGAEVGNGSTNDHSASLLNVDNTADKLSSGNLSLIKRRAKTAQPRIRPIKADFDEEMYVMFVGSTVFRDLQQDTTIAQANRDARHRGLENPIFKGAGFVYDNVVIHELPEIDDQLLLPGVGAGGITVAQNFLVGAQAIGYAVAKRPNIVMDSRDYEDKQGVAIREISEVRKVIFGNGAGDTDDLKDHGVATLYTAGVADV